MIVTVRGLASLLLVAGIFGCSGVPLRDTTDSSAVAKADSDGVGYFAVDFVEATGPTSARSNRGGAPRAHLHIPFEYVEQLNWDPDAFESPSFVALANEVEEREEEGVSPRRSRARNPYWTRRGRRGRGRKFRTTGLSVTVSRYGRGHPVGLPGHAIGIPGQAVHLPGHAVGKPAQAVGLPGQAVGLPGHAVKRPAHAVELPGQALELPGQALELPGQAVKLPGHAVERPQHPVKRPGHAVRLPGHALKIQAKRAKTSRKKP